MSGASPKAAESIRPMSLLSWQGTDDGYTGGDYLISLLRPGCWEIRYRDEPVTTTDSLKLAMTRVEFHFREQLRKRDVVTWGIWLVIWTVGLIVLISKWPSRIGSILLFTVLVYGWLSAFTRLIAATGWSHNDPYRRRLPWERHDWYERP